MKQSQWEYMSEEKLDLERRLELLINASIQSLNRALTLFGQAADIIGEVFTGKEGSLLFNRNQLHGKLAIIARTFYQNQTVKYLRMSSVTANTIWKEELQRAYWKGISQRQMALSGLKKGIEPFEKQVNELEKLRHIVAELKAALEPHITDGTLTQRKTIFERLAVVNLRGEEGQYFKEVSVRLKQAIEIAYEMLQILITIYKEAMAPIIDTCRLEIEGMQKIITSMTLGKDLKVKLTQEDLARTCDVLSWGLDDVKSIPDIVTRSVPEYERLMGLEHKLERLLKEIEVLAEKATKT